MTSNPSSPPNGRLAAIVVTHNRLEELKQTVAAYLAAAPAHLAVLVVVDNASTDGTAAWLAAQSDPRLDVVTSPENGGGAGGFALGLRHAMQAHTPDWVVLSDDDGRPAPGTLAQFHSRYRTGAQGWVTAVYTPQGEICDINRPALNPFWHKGAFWRTLRQGREGFHLGAADYASAAPIAVDEGSFVGLFLSAAAVRQAGYPDARLFIYGDDVLYTLGITASGGRLLFDPSLHFEHAFTTIAAGAQRFTPLWKAYFHHRNLLLVYRRAAGIWFWPVLMLILPKWALKIRHYHGERRAFARIMAHAVWHGLTRRLGWSLTQVRALTDR